MNDEYGEGKRCLKNNCAAYMILNFNRLRELVYH